MRNSISPSITKATVQRFIGPAFAATFMYVAARDLVDALIGPFGAGLALAINGLYLTTHPDRVMVEAPQWTSRGFLAYLAEAGITIVFGFFCGWLVLRRESQSHGPQ